MTTCILCDRNSQYVFDETKYTKEEKDDRIVYKLKPEFASRNRPIIISLCLKPIMDNPKMMYRLFSDDYIDSEEILGMI